MDGRIRRPVMGLVTVLGLALALAAPVSGANVIWGGATATFDQNFAGGLAGAIDGDLNSSGWAVFGGQHSPQTAVFLADSPVNAATLNFGLYFQTGFAGHNINEFRLSVTDDPLPSLASTWTELPLGGLNTQAPLTNLFQVGGNRVRATGNFSGTDAYAASAASPIGDITAFRLETFPFDYDPSDALAASIGRASNGNIVLTEFVVDDAAPIALPRNHALGRPATTNGSLWHGNSPAQLTDGNRGSVTHGDGAGGPTGAPPAPGFHYQVDLGTTYDISHIDLWPRQDGCCPDRLTNYRVSVFADAGGALGSEVWSADMRTDGSIPAAGPTGPDVVNDVMGVGSAEGRFVRVTSLANPVPNYALQLGEIEVYGLLTGAPLPQNVALFKPTSGDVAFGFPTANGNDGNVANITHSDNIGAVSWQVDLQGEFILDSVELVNRTDGCCPERLNGATLTVLDADLNPLFTSAPIAGAGVGQTLVFDNGGAGFFGAAYIRVNQTNQYLSIAELRAFGVPVPEPGAWALALLGGAALAAVRRRGR